MKNFKHSVRHVFLEFNRFMIVIIEEPPRYPYQQYPKSTTSSTMIPPEFHRLCRLCLSKDEEEEQEQHLFQQQQTQCLPKDKDISNADGEAKNSPSVAPLSLSTQKSREVSCEGATETDEETKVSPDDCDDANDCNETTTSSSVKFMRNESSASSSSSSSGGPKEAPAKEKGEQQQQDGDVEEDNNKPAGKERLRVQQPSQDEQLGEELPQRIFTCLAIKVRVHCCCYCNQTVSERE